ncbi:MAG TPA: DUF885 domain-containing protein [Thermoanaerobaculia bacterium]|nr:DUF885 domain-containing protein [Thermoanaerobaculia bacterium]
MKRLLFLLSLSLLAVPALAADEASRLHDLFKREWEVRLKEDPLFATSVGRHEYDDRLPSAALPDLQRENQEAHAFLDELKAIDRAKLPAADQVNYDIFQRQLENGITDFELGQYEMPFNADSGFHSYFSRLPEDMPLATVKDYRNYISRLHAWPRYVHEQIELMRMGIQRGFTVPRATLNGYDKTISAHVVDDPTKSVFWKAFEKLPSTVPEGEREKLREEGRPAIMDAVAGYREFLDFFLKEYLPHARTTLAATALPNGRAYYQQRIRQFTTLDLSPEEIHKIGLSEVDRISKEMDEVMRQTGFQGDRAAFLKFLRTDPRFYAKTPLELLERASYIAKKIDGKLPSEFGRLPRLPYTVQPVPDDIAPKYTSGRYVEAPQGSTQSGIFWVNTYQLDSRPLYNLTALALHEAVPGHHLQISLSRELSDLPNFRRFSYLSAFGEGWGLYSEWLGQEMGMYDGDPYSNFGRLGYEMWRACRLVVDTGIHAMGWTRQQAIDYMAARTSLPLHEVETEVDRYISWPAQALSYKLGELKIKALRHKAEQALGTGFDVRAFHDVVLGSGAVPLNVLESNVDRWIGSQQRERAAR